MPEEKSWVEQKAPKTAPGDLKKGMGVFGTRHISLVRPRRYLYALLSDPGMAKVGFGTNLVTRSVKSQAGSG